MFILGTQYLYLGVLMCVFGYGCAVYVLVTSVVGWWGIEFTMSGTDFKTIPIWVKTRPRSSVQSLRFVFRLIVRYTVLSSSVLCGLIQCGQHPKIGNSGCCVTRKWKYSFFSVEEHVDKFQQKISHSKIDCKNVKTHR